MSIRKQNLGDTIVELFEHLIALDKDVDTFDGHDTGGNTLKRISDAYMASKVRDEGLMSEYGDIDDEVDRKKEFVKIAKEQIVKYKPVLDKLSGTSVNERPVNGDLDVKTGFDGESG